ncbi:LacI family DNA-binding transcriptional regulator [Paenibacillus tepidiphilus]|uniref:LacI family DNA-binding transcriptional regulator n=1 Tax=Paenibacillus tepidiphilus TaxID=2608683 RepID=UPI001239EE4D|nr:LacI family DNA-binding transcriptional regulator [Paenibacillus tepidiphilus]
MNVTIKQVARRAGVSCSTVSRVATGRPNVKEETSRRVKKVMDELGYTPNIIAKNLVSGTAHSICMLLPRPAEKLLTHLFFMELVRGVLAGAGRLGFDIMLQSADGEQEELETVARLLQGRCVDGVILLSSRRDGAAVQFLERSGYPYVRLRSSGKEELESLGALAWSGGGESRSYRLGALASARLIRSIRH